MTAAKQLHISGEACDCDTCCPSGSNYPTPQALIDALGPFTLDVAATAENAKAPKFYTREIDGLKRDWFKDCGGGSIFCNPPYGRGVGRWAKKAREEAMKGVRVVCLLPVKPDTKWWDEYVCAEWGVGSPLVMRSEIAGRPVRTISFERDSICIDIYELVGRLKFANNQSGRFASAIITFDGRLRGKRV